MSLINASLMFGMFLAVMPVVLHMVMRAKPKRIEFPALRLLKARRPANSRRMQLRHLFLLCLRCLLIATLVLAIARPSLPAANYGLRWWEWGCLLLTAGGSTAFYFQRSRRSAAQLVSSAENTERRMKLRFWCTVAGLLTALVAVGIPWGLRIRAELTAPHNEATANVPVAAVFLIDTSISMNYRNENLTRLELARRTAEEHLGRFPAGSRAAVSGLNAEEEIIFQADLTGAASRLETLETTPVPDSLNRRLKAAVQMQIDDRKQTQELMNTGGTADQFAREVYVITDFSRTAWQSPDESGISDLMKTADWLHVYLIDVSVANPVNVSLTGLTLSDESLVSGRELELSMTVSSTGGMSGVTRIETLVVDSQGQETQVGAPQVMNLENGTSRVVTSVRLTGDDAFLQGLIRLTSEDPLKDDNVRYFSCGVRPRPRVLLISDLPDESIFVHETLQPAEYERLGIRYCDITAEVTANVSRQTLSSYDAVFLINCARPEETLWAGLKSFAEAGGGVIVVAGSQRIQPGSWRVPAARELLPADLVRPVRFFGDFGHLRSEADRHAVLQEFQQDESVMAELTSCAFERCWSTEVSDQSRVILSVGDGRVRHPALLERRVGEGVCLMFTSAMDNLSQGGSQWNNFPDSFSFLMLVHRTLDYVTGAGSAKSNFLSGSPVDLQVPVSQRFEQYLLRRPQLRQTRGVLPADQASLLLTDATDPGHYRVRPFESPSPFEAVFAVNFRDQETDLTRIPDEDLTKIVGPERLTLVHNPSDLQRTVRLGRLGIEVFPVLMGLIILLFCAEHLMANFFYDEAPGSHPASAH